AARGTSPTRSTACPIQIGGRSSMDASLAPVTRPNILLVVSDQERDRHWLPKSVKLPWRERLLREGVELTNYYTHSSPCSPSRASLFTGQYLPQHKVVDNVIWREHLELDPQIPTIGSILRDAGYRSSYIGKWHLSHAVSPDMTAYGFMDWDGNDRHFMGWAGTGVHFDPIIAANAAEWLRQHAITLDQPWFLTVALVNPHDVMWFPIDQPAYHDDPAHAEEIAFVEQLLDLSRWKDDDLLPLFTDDYDQVCDDLPPNFDDDLLDKPATHRQWRWDQQHGMWGYIDPRDTKSWLRHLDYYVKLTQMGDDSLGTVLQALEASGAYDDTIVIFTSDHGDMCGSHGLRSKGPFVYEEIMHVPCYVRVPGVTTGGTQASTLATHVDLASTIAALAGVDPTAQPSLKGVDLSPALADTHRAVRDHVLFAHDTAHTPNINQTRYAIRGFFDGRTKYARYYGVGGGKPSTGLWGADPGKKLYDVDAAFEDHEHEWYDLENDPHELVNLAHDRGRRAELRELFARQLAYEAAELT
ncbi:MAG TPA: sulfatase-like hydrolase/transferase, partial [Acidimicrobiia bacterium]|nr:sulfatase-like hydrolase/transferase [Acidimicrobiia bacterium]